MTKNHIILLTFSVFLSLSLKAQFYNGYNMSFGKNRVQYRPFEWHYLSAKHYNVYYYNGGEVLADKTYTLIQQKIEEYETFFEFYLSNPFIFLIYNNQSDFKQSNVGYFTSNSEYNIGGVTQISKNKAYLYFENDYKRFEQQVSKAVAQLMLNQILYGENLYQQVSSSTLLSLPLWYTNSLVDYLASGWNADIDSRMKDAVLSGKFKNFNRLTPKQSNLAGQAIWHYIALNFGKESISNVIYLAGLTKNIESAYQFVLGMTFEDLYQEVLAYYSEQYQEDKAFQTSEDNGVAFLKTKKRRVYQHLTLSKDGKKIAYTTNEKGRYIVWIYDLKTHKKKAVVRASHRLNRITDYSYPLLAWHPLGQKLIFITEEKGGFRLNTYSLDEKKIEKDKILYFSKIMSTSFSDDGQYLVFTAQKKGQTDIFSYHFLTRTAKAVTNDKAEEKDARFVNNTSSLIFSSNRATDDVHCDSVQEQYDLFLYKKNEPQLHRLTETPFVDEQQIQVLSNNRFLYLDSKYGINNVALLKFDSMVSFVDTAIHYRYFTHKKEWTHQPYNILSYQYFDDTLFTIQRFHSKNQLRKYGIDKTTSTIHPQATQWKKNDTYRRVQEALYQHKQDSLSRIQVDYPDTDTSLIDYNNYVFDLKFSDVKKGAQEKDKKKAETPQSQYYFTSFFHQNLQTQLDFGFLSQSYQTFTGSGVYYNPGLNLFTKWSINDLFENYRFTIGARLTANLNSGEWLFLLEDLSRRLDKQYVYHRHSFLDVAKNTYRKTISNQLMYILRYPFNEVTALKATFEYRLDRGVYKTIDRKSLLLPDEYNHWAGLRLEYIFDNSLPLGTNLYTGWRNKIFFEAYTQVDEQFKDLYVLGFDFRHYQRIHRSLIWASRLAGSRSFGQQKLIYYLGSTDNWINFSSQVPAFDQSVKINHEMNWAFQALATNMRGFSQNARNGNTFVVFNNELRCPVVRYFSQRPISSSFWYNFQLITFFDIGTAFSGSSPYSDLNAYNSIDHKDSDYPVSIVIDNQRSPLIYGYGFGVRTKLLGYFVRADYAWGIDGDVVLPSVFYLSLSLDF